MRNFSDLNEQEVLALAISLEEEDARTYDTFATALKENHPDSAKVFSAMSEEEDGHRHRLLTLYQKRFGMHIPLIRRQDVKGFVPRTAFWLIRPLKLERVLREVEVMETETRRFYSHAQSLTTDAELRQLLGDLANEERRHEQRVETLESAYASPAVRENENKSAHRLFVLQVVQPGLAGLMDGSVSTLAPLFAAAVATQSSWETFLVGLAAALGAGISMGFAEALSDDGSLTGRGSPWVRGVVCGAMTALGGLGHALPFLIANFRLAMAVAMAVVIFELAAIAWIRHRYMDTPFFSATVQVVIGGALVFATGMLIGGA